MTNEHVNRKYAMTRLALVAAPFIGMGGGPWIERPRKPPRWQVLGYESEAAYLKRTPETQATTDSPAKETT